MDTMGYSAEPLEMLMRFGADAQLAKRASDWAKPIVSKGITAFTTDEGEQAPAAAQFSIPDMLVELSRAINRPVRDIIMMPDDGQNALIKAKILSGELSPKKKIGIVLAEIYGSQAKLLKEGVRKTLREGLSRGFFSRAPGLEQAMEAAKADILYYYFCVAIMGDEIRTKRLSGLVRCLQSAVPLAVVNMEKNIWMVHRVA